MGQCPSDALQAAGTQFLSPHLFIPSQICHCSRGALSAAAAPSTQAVGLVLLCHLSFQKACHCILLIPPPPELSPVALRVPRAFSGLVHVALGGSHWQ